MRTLFTLLFFAAAIAAACIKENKVGGAYVIVTYKQTQCSDPWKTVSNDSITLVNAVHYLDSLQLYIAGINLTYTNKQQTCTACACETGKLINVTTLNSDTMIAKYKRLGFE